MHKSLQVRAMSCIFLFTVYGFGTLSVILISCCSLLGAVVVPCMKHAKFDLVMLFFIAMAIGTLITDSLLHLIPEVSRSYGGELQEEEEES